MPLFEIVSDFRTTGDQPQAVDALVDGLESFFARYKKDLPGWVRRDYLGRKLRYAEQYTTVRLYRRIDPEQGGSPYYRPLNYPYLFSEHEEVRVAVEHTFYLSVPYADLLFVRIGDARPPRDGLRRL